MTRRDLIHRQDAEVLLLAGSERAAGAGPVRKVLRVTDGA